MGGAGVCICLPVILWIYCFLTMKKFKKKVGLPPGSLVFTGKQHAKEVKIDIIDYGPESFKELKSENIEECFPLIYIFSYIYLHI